MYTFQTNFSGFRTQSRGGRDYLIAPATLIVAGVLNNSLVPSDDIAASASAWNGTPVTVPHPANEDGELSPIGASPAIYEAHRVGTLFNVYFDNDRLRAEVHIDLELAGNVAGGSEVVGRIKANEQVEVSTGYFAKMEPETGEYAGVAYNSRQSGIVPDHFAILPNEKGACSIDDGCGIHNSARLCECDKSKEGIDMTIESNQATQGEELDEVTVDATPSTEGGEVAEPGFRSELDIVIDELGLENVLAALRGVVTNAKSERDAVIESISNRSDLTEADLSGMPLAALKKIDNTLNAKGAASYAANTAAGEPKREVVATPLPAPSVFAQTNKGGS